MSSPALDKFAELEVWIARTIKMVNTTREEKESAEKELAAARKHVARLESEIAELSRERDLIRNKVESLMENLSALSEEAVV